MAFSTIQTASQELIVGVGDCRVSGWPVPALTTYALGSCIAVMAYDWRTRLGGLLHVMLPDSSIKRPACAGAVNPFMYVDTGLPELFRLLEGRGASRARIRCCMAGGANMMVDSSSFEIGKRNHLALKKAFWKLGVFVDCEDVGGNDSRSVRLDLESGRVDLRKGGAAGRILVPARLSLVTEGGASDDSVGR